MSDYFKRIFFTISFLAICIFLSACERDTTSTEVKPSADNRETISFSVIDLTGDNNVGTHAAEIKSRIEDYCGVRLDILWIANDSLSAKNISFLSSPRNMPDIMSWGGAVTSDVITAAKNGAFVDLSKYVWDSDKYPNLSAMSKDVAANLTIDGKLIGIPRTRVIGREGLSYRADWAEKLGVTLPENATPEDVYKMLYAFTYQDPDGNGIDDTIGLEMASYTGVFDIIQTWFGCGNGWQENPETGELVPVWTTDNFFMAVAYIKRLYEDGLMPADWAFRPTDNWSSGCKSGENGVFIDVLDAGKRIWQYFEADETFTPSVVNPDIPASMILYGAINGHTLATAGYNGFFTLSAATLNTPERIEAALTLLDRLNDPEMLLITQYGLEGIHFKYDEDGKIVDLDIDDGTLAGDYKGFNQMLPYLPSSEAAVLPVQSTKFNEAQDAAYAAALPHAVSNPALSYLVGSETYAILGKTLDDDVNSLRTQYVLGVISREELKDGLEEIRHRGYDTIIDEVNAQYITKAE